MSLARLVANSQPFYYRLTRQTPKFTAYSLETVCSNSVISHAKASRELGYHARPLIEDCGRYHSLVAQKTILPTHLT